MKSVTKVKAGMVPSDCPRSKGLEWNMNALDYVHVLLLNIHVYVVLLENGYITSKFKFRDILLKVSLSTPYLFLKQQPKYAQGAW